MEDNMISKELEEKVKAAESLEDVVKACAEEGIKVTKEQLETAVNQTEGGELSEDTLDNVSGGVSVKGLWRVVLPFIPHFPKPIPKPLPKSFKPFR